MNVRRSLFAHIFSVARIITTLNAKIPVLTFSFYELGYKSFLVPIASFLSKLRLLLQHYFDIVDYVGSLYTNKVPYCSIVLISAEIAGQSPLSRAFWRYHP